VIPEGVTFYGGSRVAEDAWRLAEVAHAGQKYGRSPYMKHVCDVVRVARVQFPEDEELHIASILHDTIEQTVVTEADLHAHFGDGVAKLVWAVTPGPGENRTGRNAETYRRIREVGVRAVKLRLCDRIANVEACWETRDRRLFMYRDEHGALRENLWSWSTFDSGTAALWDRLDKLFGWRKGEKRT